MTDILRKIISNFHYKHELIDILRFWHNNGILTIKHKKQRMKGEK